MHVTMRRVGIAEHVLRTNDLEARRVGGHQDLRLAQIWWAVGAGLDHGDHDLAARVAGPGDIVLLAVDHILVAHQGGAGIDVLGVRRGRVQLGHGKGRTDLAGQQRLQPLLLLGRRADPFQDFHIAGVGCCAVHGLRRHAVLAQLNGDIGIIQVRHPLAGLSIGQEEVPQAFGLGLVLGLFQALQLAGYIGPNIGVTLTQAMKLLAHRVDGFGYEPLHMIEQRLGLGRHPQIVQFILRVQAEGRLCPGFGLAHLVAPIAL